MRIKKLSRTAAVAAAGVAAGLAIGGGAVALAGGPADEVTACVANKGGVVRVVTPSQQCHKDEHRLVWAKTGQPGPSAVYALQFATVRNNTGSPPAAMRSFQLPAGNYLLHADVTVTYAASAVECWFYSTVAGGGIGSANETASTPGSVTYGGALSISAPAANPKGNGTFSLFCWGTAGFSVSGELIATATGALKPLS